MLNAGETSPADAGEGRGGVSVIRKVASALTCWILNGIFFLLFLLFLLFIFVFVFPLKQELTLLMSRCARFIQPRVQPICFALSAVTWHTGNGKNVRLVVPEKQNT